MEVELNSLFFYLCAETTRQFEIAFKMIDADLSDFLDLKEFSRVNGIFLSGSSL